MILSIDQGTTGTTILVLNHQGVCIGRGYQELKGYFPRSGWVEQDPNEIWEVTLIAVKLALADANICAKQLTAIGITNQRETALVWERESGQPVYNAIVWQCRRSSDICQMHRDAGFEETVRKKTGLVLDAYFSGTKLEWLFNQNNSLLQKAKEGKLAFGTIDSWLIWKLTNGKSHCTDHTNASRTLLYNIEKKSWDEELLSIFGIPRSLLPSIKSSAEYIAKTDPEAFFGASIPITGIAGDQQAALFGQRCLQKGQIKNTYGTGCFMLMYTGEQLVRSSNGLLTTIACNEKGEPSYALEGSVFTAGSAIQWLRDKLQIISSAEETEVIALSIESTNGVYLVPAFSGLGAPYWNMETRGTLVGLTQGVGRAEIIRATLESIAFQANELACLMSEELRGEINIIKVDGGACQNDFLMQMQADLTQVEVMRPQNIESTAIGAGILAAIGAKIWNADAIPEVFQATERRFIPHLNKESREDKIKGWEIAIRQAQAGTK